MIMKSNWLDGLAKSAKGNFTLDDMAICKTTHPTMPNDSLLQRGRKIHLTKDGKKSICNMTVVQFYNNNNWATKNRCKICFKEYL